MVFFQISEWHIAKLTVVVANQTRALHSDPQISVCVRRKTQNRTSGHARRVSVIEQPEVQTVEAYQTIFGSNPQVAVAGLRNGAHCSAGKSLFGSPAVVGIKRQNAVGIRAARGIEEAQPHQGGGEPAA